MMTTTEEIIDGEWLSLSAASDLIGVHPATLRAWANQGRVASQRTAGGHRRFRRSDLDHWAKTQHEPLPGIEMLIHNALGRVRMTLESPSFGGMDHVEMPWLDRLDADARSQHRDLGRRLLTDLATALDAEAPSSATRTLGADYARLSRRQGLTLSEAVQAFLFFRDSLIDSLIQMAAYAGASASPDWLRLTRRLNDFTNTVLLGLIETYQQLDSER